MSRLTICFLAGSLIAPVGAQTSSLAPSEMAIVYFYRVKEANAQDSRKAGVKLEGKELLKMPENNFVGFRFAPGKYGLRMGQKQPEISLSVKPGKRYFVRVIQALNGFGLYQSLTLMPEGPAIYQMRDMKPLEDKNIKDKSREVNKDKPVSRYAAPNNGMHPTPN
jgi:hypothetical protein